MPGLMFALPGVLGKLQKRLGKSERFMGGPLLGTVQAFLDKIKAGDLATLSRLWSLGTSLRERDRVAWKGVWTDLLPEIATELPSKIRAEIRRLDPESPAGGSVSSSQSRATSSGSPKSGKTPKAKATQASATERAATGVATALLKSAGQAATRRVWTGRYDSRGRKIMRTVASAAPAPSGAAAAARGGAQLGRALAATGVVIAGLAAGYWIGTQLNKYLAGRALSKERAGVQAALAFREARKAAEAAQGRALSATQVRSLGEVYRAQLTALGYDPVTFTRKRSLVERFFTGQEDEEE